jgi:hypothetical protein
LLVTEFTWRYTTPVAEVVMHDGYPEMTCARCGSSFSRTEAMETGNRNRVYDAVCPNCNQSVETEVEAVDERWNVARIPPQREGRLARAGRRSA